MEFLVITAFYDKGDRFRRRNMEATLSHNVKVFPEATFCVAEMNPTGWLEGLNIDWTRVRHIKVDREGEFCKTALLNMAVQSNPEFDVIVMVDADVYLSEQVVDYIRDNWDKGSLVFPFSEVDYLKETDTRLLVAGKPLLPGEKDHGVIIDRQTGLCNVFTRETYDTVGHYDEDFVKWGAEDDAFLTKCKRLVGPIKRNRKPGCPVYHLFHPVVNTVDYVRTDSTYVANRVRQACIRRMSDADLRDYAAGTRNLSELVAKYTDMGRLEIELNWQCTPHGTLNIDTTIYDIDRSGEMSFTKVMEAVREEDTPEGCVEFIDNPLMLIPDLSEEQIAELQGLRQKYEDEARCSSPET